MDRKTIRKLHPGEDTENLMRLSRREKIKKLLLLTAGFAALSVLLLLVSSGRTGISSLKRPDCGSGSKEETVILKPSGEEEEEISLTILPEEPEETEAEQLFEAAYEEICESITGENASLEHITEDLVLLSSALDGKVSAEWTSMAPALLDSFGGIVKSEDEISQDGETGSLQLTLRVSDYEKEYEIPFTVFPKELTAEEERKADLQKAVNENLHESEVTLPDSYGDEKLTWYSSGGTVSWGYLIFGFGAAILWVFVSDSQKKKEALQNRSRELEMDYPWLLSEFTVYIQAGMMPRGVWEQIVNRYENRQRKGGEKRFLYEEMKITLQQMKNGYPEGNAYIDFGKRMELSEYRRFAALLEQNMRQGTTKISDRLREEAENAFELRRQLAKEQGEEAQSKLLIPMMMNLCVVFAVVMIPAFLSMN